MKIETFLAMWSSSERILFTAAPRKYVWRPITDASLEDGGPVIWGSDSISPVLRPHDAAAWTEKYG